MANSMTGQIVNIRVERQDVVISLDNDPAKGPRNNSFILRGDHFRFNAAFSLTLAAAANRWPVRIRIGGDGEIDSAAEATVRYISVAWRADHLDDEGPDAPHHQPGHGPPHPPGSSEP